MAENKEKQVQVEEEENQEEGMTLNDHLRELRNRIVVCVVFLIVGFLLSFNKSQEIVDILTKMALSSGYVFVTLTPQELLIQYMRIGLVGALIISSPILGFEVWAFVQPGLKKGENLFFFCALVAGLFCFVLGVSFAHFISMPFMLQFLINLNTTNYIASSISIENYLSFIITVYLIFGMVFEMPVLSVILTQFGLLKPNWLIKGRSVAIVIIFFIAALITPPDIVSQIMVAFPMLFLYQISIYLCKFFFKIKVKADPYASDEDLKIAGVKKRKEPKVEKEKK